jgi:methyl-accepting chemotaxis protein
VKSLGKKILFLVLGLVLVVFATTMFFVTKYSYDTVEEDVSKLVA